MLRQSSCSGHELSNIFYDLTSMIAFLNYLLAGNIVSIIHLIRSASALSPLCLRSAPYCVCLCVLLTRGNFDITIHTVLSSNRTSFCAGTSLPIPSHTHSSVITIENNNICVVYKLRDPLRRVSNNKHNVPGISLHIRTSPDHGKITTHFLSTQLISILVLLALFLKSIYPFVTHTPQQRCLGSIGMIAPASR